MQLMKSDRRVIILLMLIAVVCLCVMIYRDAMMSEKEGNDVGKEIVDNEHGENRVGLKGDDNAARADLGTFDPNTVDSITLLKYGLGPVQIRSLMGYRRHNGTFDRPLAVSKLYNWSDEDVDKVLPYIVIGDKYKKTYHYREQYEEEKRAEYERRGGYEYGNKSHEHSNNSTSADKEVNYERKYDALKKFTSLTKVDINTADTTLLKRIPGVGTGIANAIVKLRDRLGGFYKVEQLAEMKYISPELYEWFKVEPSPDLHLININKASFQTLNAHPYISYDQTRDLMSYRRLYGTIKDKAALLSTNIFTKEEVERLSPYLEY